MKKLFIVLAAISMVLFACKKDNIEKNEPDKTTPYDNLSPQQQTWALCINYTGSWCSACGVWGEQAMDDAVNETKVVGMALKVPTDPQAIPQALLTSFESDRPRHGSVPVFWVGDGSGNQNPAYYCRKLHKLPCSIGIDARQEITNGTLSVYVKTKNFEAISNISDYYIAAYLLEDGLHYPQLGSSSSDPVHNFVLRKASSGDDYFGQQLLKDGAANAEFTHTFTFNLSSYNANNCYAAVVLYKKTSDSPQYSYVNSFWTRK